MKSWKYIVLLLFVAVACKKETSTEPLSDPFERWRSFGIHNYTIDQVRTCFCPNASIPMRLTVRSDTVFSVTRISDGTAITFSESQPYWSVEKLFANIKSLQDSMVIRYNDKYGYPEYLDINPAGHPVDAGALYQTSNLQIQ
jgi:hypothetical protein